MMTKPLRFQLFLDRLGQAEAVASHDTALSLIEKILNAVEDEYSGIAFNPHAWQSDGRMYPPQEDMASAAVGYSHVTVYRSRSHRTYIAENGAFMITEVFGSRMIIQKCGVDGRHVEDFRN